MTLDERYLPALHEALAGLQRAADNLRFTLSRVDHLLPLDGKAVGRLTAEDRERLDALAARYSRCQQMAGNAFKALALAEAEPQPRFIDLLTLMHKRGLIDSVAEWDAQRDLRNNAAHIYLSAEAEVIAFYYAVAESAGRVAEYADRLAAYVARF
ncbi:MAG: hypothetical protein ACM31L_07095 [Actinomycetota bacterium]